MSDTTETTGKLRMEWCFGLNDAPERLRVAADSCLPQDRVYWTLTADMAREVAALIEARNRGELIPADEAAARVAAAYEAAANCIEDQVANDNRQNVRNAMRVAAIFIRSLDADDAQAALARLLAAAKAEGMREAYTICKGVRRGAETDDYGIGALDCAIAILAAADKVAAK